MDGKTMKEARGLMAAFRAAAKATPFETALYNTALDNCEEFARVNAIDLLADSERAERYRKALEQIKNSHWTITDAYKIADLALKESTDATER